MPPLRRPREPLRLARRARLRAVLAGALLSAAPALAAPEPATPEPAASATPTAPPTAPQPDEAALERARSAFRAAEGLEQRGLWAEAEAELRVALAVKETPGLRFHLAHCLEQQGKPLAATREYERAAELVAAGQPAADVEPLLPGATARARGQIPRLRLTASGDARGWRVLLDGRAVLLDTELEVEAGKHRVTVEAPGHRPTALEVGLSAREQRTVTLSAERAAEAPRTTPAALDTAPSDGGRRAVLVGEAAVSLLALGFGAVFFVQHEDAAERVTDLQARIDAQASDPESACHQPLGALLSTCRELEQAADDRDRAGTWATAGFVVGGVGALATLTTYLLWRPPSDDTVAVKVAPSRHGALLGLTGRF